MNPPSPRNAGSASADYCADEISVDASLISRIRRWQEWHNFELTLLPALERSFNGQAFAAEGLAIARALKAALPDWTVIDLHGAVAARSGDTPCDAFERGIE